MQPRQDPNYVLTKESDFDVVFEAGGVAWNDQHWACLCHLLRHGDIWSTSFQPFFPVSNRDPNALVFVLLRFCGIRIIVFPYGTDVAYRDQYRDRYDWVGRLQEDYPDWDLATWGETTRRRVKLFCRFAALVIGMDSSVARFLSRNDLYFKSFPVDTEELKPRIKIVEREVPVIVHATNHRHVKGTPLLINAVETLQKAGVLCDLQLVERVDREEAFRRYEQADIIADQFVMGAYGVFALESLALGKPVLTYLDSEHLANPVFNLPIVNTTHENIASVLAVLILVPSLRQRLGRASREEVVRFQSVEAMSEVWTQIYNHVWWGKELELEKTQHFSEGRKARSFCEDPARPEFWPVKVADIGDEIAHALSMLTQGSTSAAF